MSSYGSNDELISASPPLRAKIDADLLLSYLGSFGRFQRSWYLLLCLPCVAAAFVTLAPVFTAATPNYRCRVDSCDYPDNATYQDAFTRHFANFSIPRDPLTGESSSCHVFSVNGSISNGGGDDDRCVPSHFDRGSVSNCDRFIFDTSVYATTIVTDFNLTCDQSWKIPLAQSVFFAALLLSAAPLGHFSDCFGRKNIFMVSLLLMSVGGSGLALAHDYHVYLALQTVAAVGQLGVFGTAFVLGVENAGKEQRVLCGIVIEYFFVLGEVLVALVAWRVRYWRSVVACVMVPSFAFLAYWPFLPESVRWLLSRHKEEEAQLLADKMARWNKKQNVDVEDFRKLEEEVVPVTEGVMAALKSKIFLSRTANLSFCWLVVAMTYYGLSMNSASLSGDPHFNFFLVALVEVPGYTISYYTMEKLGRRWSVSGSLLVCGAAIMTEPFVSGQWLRVGLFLLGKLGVTCAFGTVYLYTSELYPTNMRSLGVGVSSMFGRLGAVLSPYVALAGAVKPWLPLVLFGGSAVVSGLLVLLLPETLGKDLPDTLEEALRLGGNHNNTEVVDGDEPSESDPLLS